MPDIQEKITKAEQAKARAIQRLAKLKAKATAAERRADAHRKITLGGLVIAAGCDGWDPAAIAGALVDVRKNIATPEQIEKWREEGITLLEARRLSRQSGMSLLSILVALGLGLSVLAVGWTVATHARRTQDVQAASQQAVTLSKRITGAWSASSDFATLSTAAAQARGVFQRGDLNPAGQPVNPWGGSVTVGPLGGGYSIIFAGVPAKDCPGLVAASAAGFSTVSVQVATAWQEVAANGKADMTAATTACAGAGDPLAVQFGGGRVGASFPISPLTPCTTPAPVTAQQTLGCPVGQTGSIVQAHTHDYVCMSPYGAATPGPWTPWVTVSDTCAPPPCGPSPSPVVTGCPAGQTGSITTPWTSAPSPTCWTPGSPVSTCTPTPPPPPPPCAPAPAPVSGSEACPFPKLQAGSITTSQGWVSAPSPTCWSPGTVTVVFNDCHPINAANCICPCYPPLGGGGYGPAPVNGVCLPASNPLTHICHVSAPVCN